MVNPYPLFFIVGDNYCMTSSPYHKLITAYSGLFKDDIEIKCDYGWGTIIEDMCFSLDYMIIDNPNPTSFQINKIENLFGVLNIEYDYVDIHAKKIIDFAQRLSYHTCETCGNKGKIYCSNKWLTWSKYKVLCKQHAIKYFYYEIRHPKGKT